MAIASLIIALISLLFGAFTYFRHDRKLKEQQRIINAYQITKLQREIGEAKKAEVRATVVNRSESGIYSGTLLIKNYGKGAASNVYFTRRSYGNKGSFLPTLTYPQLLPQEQQETPLSWGFGFGGNVEVILSWTDESGERRESRQSLQL